MYKKTITYTDYMDNERTEDFYFYLNKAEVTNWLLTDGDYTLDAVLQRLSSEHDAKKIMEIFEDLLHKSYGRISLDGRRFEKTEELWLAFKETEAFSNLYMELVGDAKAAGEFVSGIVPSDLKSELDKILKANPDGIPNELRDYIPDTVQRGLQPVR